MLSINKTKVLVVFLIIGNAALFTYYNLTDKNNSKPVNPIIPNIKQLTLLNERNNIVKEEELLPTKKIKKQINVTKKIELDAIKKTEKPTVEEIIKQSTDKVLCYTIGPFETRKDKTYTQIQLSSFNILSSERVILEKEISSYFIYIPPHKTKKAALKTVEKLKRKNIRDFYLIGTGPKENGIALGLFSQEKHANKRYNILRKLYFNAKIEARYQDKEIYWLDYKAKESTLDLINFKKLSPLPLQLYLRKC